MYIKVNDNNFEQEVLQSELSVLVDFWAPWCGPCQILGPTIEEIAEEYKGKLKVCKVNVDESQAAASEYGIVSIPTLAVFKNGKAEKQSVGALSKGAVEAMIKPYL